MSNQTRLARVLVCNCCARLMKSPVILILFIIQVLATISATQAQRYSPSEAGGLSPMFPIQKSNEPAKLRLLQADPIVFNANSLYTLTLDRHKRSAGTSPLALSNQQQRFVDACQSKMEVLTPYYATNSKGKLRTIVNSELMQQAIQVETCARSTQPTKAQTDTASAPNRCNAQPECGCEQKYKWHRLLVLDPTTDESASSSKGLFMDWFLFPSNCVCRCKSGPSSTRHFLRTIMPSSLRAN